VKIRKLVNILLIAVFSFILCGASNIAAAETNWPTRPVSIIVPFIPGGDSDFHARLHARFLETELGQPFIIVNVAGAGGTIGATQVSVAAPDGYTVLFYQTGALFTNKLVESTDLDHNSFAISCIAMYDETNVIVAGVDAGFADAADFLERVRANPYRYSVATTIPGFSFYTVIRMQTAGNFRLNLVDVGGAGAMVPSLLGNHTELAANAYGVFRQHIENGTIIPLMTSAERRNPNFPDVPTMKEMGLEDAQAPRAGFFAFPLGTDPVILQRLADAVRVVHQNPEYIRELRESFSMEPFFLDTPYVQEFLDDMWVDMARFRDYLNQ